MIQSPARRINIWTPAAHQAGSIGEQCDQRVSHPILIAKMDGDVFGIRALSASFASL